MTATTQMEMPESDAVHEFFKKDIPEPYQILGLKLLPLSIGRYRHMARHNIGFVSESKTKIGGSDLLLGVLICSMTCEKWDALSTSKELPKVIAKWMRKIKAAPPIFLRGSIGIFISQTFIGKWWRKNHSFNLQEKSGLFKAYLDESQKFPKFLVKRNSDRTSVSHWSQNIEAVLRSDLNWSAKEIEEAPLSKAISDYFKHMENQGLITILSDADYAIVTHNDAGIKKALAEWEAKQKGENGL